MQRFRKSCVALLALSLILPSGCRMFSGRPAAAPDAAPTASFGNRVKAASKLVAQKTKGAAITTLSYIGAGVMLVGGKIIKSAFERDEEDKRGFDPDPLWRQGYGFNNPNNERLRQGLPPVNFDGSVSK